MEVVRRNVGVVIVHGEMAANALVAMQLMINRHLRNVAGTVQHLERVVSEVGLAVFLRGEDDGHGLDELHPRGIVLGPRVAGVRIVVEAPVQRPAFVQGRTRFLGWRIGEKGPHAVFVGVFGVAVVLLFG